MWFGLSTEVYSPNGCVISQNSVAFGADYVKVVKIHGYFLQRKCRPENLVFNDVSFMTISQAITPSESIKVSLSALVRENLTNNQP